MMPQCSTMSEVPVVPPEPRCSNLPSLPTCLSPFISPSVPSPTSATSSPPAAVILSAVSMSA